MSFRVCVLLGYVVYYSDDCVQDGHRTAEGNGMGGRAWQRSPFPAVSPKGSSTAGKVSLLLHTHLCALRNLVSKCSGLCSCSLEITRNHNFLFTIPTDRVMKTTRLWVALVTLDSPPNGWGRGRRWVICHQSTPGRVNHKGNTPSTQHTPALRSERGAGPSGAEEALHWATLTAWISL